MQNVEAEIFVVDNNSSDGSKAFFKDKFAGIHFIWNQENTGFAKANNMALQRASGKYILFLNPDTIVPEDCFEKCLSFLESHEDAGAMGVKMLDGSGRFLKESKRSFPSPLTSFYKLSGLAKLFPHSKTFSKYHLGNLDNNKDHEVDVLAGAFMLVPRKIIDVVGSFDEKFFMYGEDIDLSYRIQKSGYKNYYFSGCSILHFKGESTRKGGLNYVRLFYKAMSIFAKKHYGERALFFNFLIQTAILVRAVLSGIKRFLHWIGMPVIDASIILSGFWITKIFWNIFIKKDINYSPNLLDIAFPAFTFIFLAASYYSGLYDDGYKQKRLNHSTIIAFLILLSVYSLLPEEFRFSRGILVMGCLLAFTFMSFVRWLFINWKIIDSINPNDEHRKTFIVGTEKEFAGVNLILQKAGMEERIFGRLDANENINSTVTGNIDNINKLLSTYPVKEIIFCEGNLSYKKIISLVSSLEKKIRIKIYTNGANGIIGSNSKNTSGDFVSQHTQIRLCQPVSRRSKSFFDVTLSLFFIITFPVHFFLQKKISSFYKNVFAVLLNRKTWVGYVNTNSNLPALIKGVLTSTGLPNFLNNLPLQTLEASDKWYATDYEVWEDVKIIWRGYKYLGT